MYGPSLAHELDAEVGDANLRRGVIAWDMWCGEFLQLEQEL